MITGSGYAGLAERSTGWDLERNTRARRIGMSSRRSRWSRSRLLQISKDNRVVGYLPAHGLIEAAQERTEGMVLYYREAVRNMDFDWKMEWDYLERLARSCYIQGAQDTAMVAAQ